MYLSIVLGEVKENAKKTAILLVAFYEGPLPFSALPGRVERGLRYGPPPAMRDGPQHARI